MESASMPNRPTPLDSATWIAAFAIVVPVAQDMEIKTWALLLQLGYIPAVAYQDRTVPVNQQKTVVARETCQIRDVGKIGDEERVDGGFPNQSAKFVAPLVESMGHSSVDFV